MRTTLLQSVTRKYFLMRKRLDPEGETGRTHTMEHREHNAGGFQVQSSFPSHTDTSTVSMQGRQAGKNVNRQTGLRLRPAELTNHTTGVVVSAPQVSFSLSGGASLACGFSCLFSPRGDLPVPACGCSASCRFGGGRQGGAVRFFSLEVVRSHRVWTGEGFSISPLWAEQGAGSRRAELRG